MYRLYYPLNHENQEIRLLTLLPISRLKDIVHCTVTTHSLVHFSQGCLTYLEGENDRARTDRRTASEWMARRTMPGWEDLAPLQRVNRTRPPSYLHRFDARQTSEIVLNGRTTKVSSNLVGALRQFSKESEFEDGFKLWGDAICINQADLEERAIHFQRMREIYGSAWVVVGWLGDEADQSSSAILLLKDLAKFSNAENPTALGRYLQLEPHFLGKGCWLALEELINREYWYRLWIIQEVVMGATATWIRCGSAYVDWSIFCEGIAFLQEHLWLVKDSLLQQEASESGSKNAKQTWATTSLHLIHQDLSLLSHREEEGGGWPSFGRLLDISNCGVCTDPRDKVYALIGLMPPEVQALLDPDYNADPAEIYSSTASIFIQAFNTLDPLREGNPWGPTGNSSWAADWQWRGRLRWSRTENRLWLPAYLFPQNDSYESTYTPYRASGEMKADPLFESNGKLLTCTGFVLDSVSGLAARGKGYFSWVKRSTANPQGWNSAYGSFEETSEALWRTMLVDRVEGRKRASPLHAVILNLPSTFETAENQFVSRGWTWLAGLRWYYFRWEAFQSANREFVMGHYRFGDFFSDVIPVDASEHDMTERRFMTTAKGHFGWAPDNIFGNEHDQTRVGDLIAIIFGCATPIIIRPKGAHFQVLGEAYLHGFMDGEALENLASGDFQCRKFTFS
ncbi:hypothetical protein EJ08DRAFT_686883 [Tothia fuscella]|uniref:Heterokaryon incompatibility domain-containing protein n=1 Tax=Tothia fuscella TaxID=1048955 RepID=A0A9P4U0F8_9PEZI|nr:hypothetical protein EJ08DRAFT_686883 [Tothia fuscella]